MGLYDTVHVFDDRFVCSEGHPLSGEDFQTYDLGSTMGHATIADGKLSFREGDHGHPVGAPFTLTLRLCCDCRQCPAFVQAHTGNLVAMFIELGVTCVDGIVTAVEMLSEPTADFLVNTPLEPHMLGCAGPMPYAEAEARHRAAVDARTATVIRF